MIVWFMVRSTCFTVTFTVLEDATTGMYALRLVLVAVRVALTSTNGDGDFVRDCLAAIIELEEGGTLLGSLGRGDEANVSDVICVTSVLRDRVVIVNCLESWEDGRVTILVVPISAPEGTVEIFDFRWLGIENNVGKLVTLVLAIVAGRCNVVLFKGGKGSWSLEAGATLLYCRGVGDDVKFKSLVGAARESEKDGELLDSPSLSEGIMVEDFVSEVLVLEDGCRLRGCNEVSDGVVVTTLVGAL